MPFHDNRYITILLMTLIRFSLEFFFFFFYSWFFHSITCIMSIQEIDRPWRFKIVWNSLKLTRIIREMSIVIINMKRQFRLSCGMQMYPWGYFFHVYIKWARSLKYVNYKFSGNFRPSVWGSEIKKMVISYLVVIFFLQLMAVVSVCVELYIGI